MDIRTAALLVGRPDLPDYFLDAVARMAATGVDIELVLLAGEAPDTDEGIVERLKDRLLPSPPRRDCRDESALAGAELRRVDPVPAASGPGVELPDEAVSRLAEVDLAVHNGVGILQGDVLAAPAAGVLGYHHGDLRAYRGSYYGVWEFLDGVDQGGVTVQLLGTELDAGEVVAFEPVDIADAPTVAEVRRRLWDASVPLLSRAVEHLRDEEFEPDHVPAAELGPVYYRSAFDRRAKLRLLLADLQGRLGLR
jgi:hypothetical protein